MIYLKSYDCKKQKTDFGINLTRVDMGKYQPTKQFRITLISEYHINLLTH